MTLHKGNGIVQQSCTIHHIYSMKIHITAVQYLGLVKELAQVVMNRQYKVKLLEA